ncbi:hypothetical protein G5674_22235 [Escherichia coli]|nr:hypothetical protein [Escherichia coli]
MFTYYQAENSTAEPALVNAIEQGKVRISRSFLPKLTR